MSGSFVPGSHHSALVALKQLALQLYRFAVVATIVWLIRDVAVRQRIQGDSPVTAAEVVSLIPTAASLRPDDSARDGLFVLDRTGRELGYVVRTQPACRDILGYAGTTDALVVLDRDPLACAPEELPEVSVVATMVGGRWVHNSPPW